jgi:hypothetical protein
MHGVARDHEGRAGAEDLLAAAKEEHALPLEDHDRFLAVVAVNGCCCARVDRLYPDLEALATLKWAGDGAMGEAGKLVLLDLVMSNDH